MVDRLSLLGKNSEQCCEHLVFYSQPISCHQRWRWSNVMHLRAGVNLKIKSLSRVEEQKSIISVLC